MDDKSESMVLVETDRHNQCDERFRRKSIISTSQVSGYFFKLYPI